MTRTTDMPLVADPAYAVPASRDQLERAAETLIARGMDARVVADGAAARSEFDRLVPDGASIDPELAERPVRVAEKEAPDDGLLDGVLSTPYV